MRNSGATSAPVCPACGSPARRGPLLPKAMLARALEEFVEAPLPAGIALHDYAMCRCTACTLEFADPPAPADDAFYRWLDQHSRYYEQQRWEWDRVQEVLARQRGATVLEIGAGDGRFLRRLRETAGATTVAIERSDAAVAALRDQGIEAHAAADADRALAGRRFDFVLAFHCLEHVPDPAGLLGSMRARAGDAGRVLFSVPYSPMYFERRWFDPLNHPPHHLSRWNARALEALAHRCGGRAHLQFPPARSAFARARYSLAIQHLGPHWMRGRRWRAMPGLHPLGFVAELAAQLGRERVDGRTAADVVLVELLRD